MNKKEGIWKMLRQMIACIRQYVLTLLIAEVSEEINMKIHLAF